MEFFICITFLNGKLIRFIDLKREGESFFLLFEHIKKFSFFGKLRKLFMGFSESSTSGLPIVELRGEGISLSPLTVEIKFFLCVSRGHQPSRALRFESHIRLRFVSSTIFRQKSTYRATYTHLIFLSTSGSSPSTARFSIWCFWHFHNSSLRAWKYDDTANLHYFISSSQLPFGFSIFAINIKDSLKFYLNIVEYGARGVEDDDYEIWQHLGFVKDLFEYPLDFLSLPLGLWITVDRANFVRRKASIDFSPPMQIPRHTQQLLSAYYRLSKKVRSAYKGAPKR